jgi:hypothetical protein
MTFLLSADECKPVMGGDIEAANKVPGQDAGG